MHAHSQSAGNSLRLMQHVPRTFALFPSFSTRPPAAKRLTFAVKNRLRAPNAKAAQTGAQNPVEEFCAPVRTPHRLQRRLPKSVLERQSCTPLQVVIESMTRHKLQPKQKGLLYPPTHTDIVHMRSPTHLHSPPANRRGRSAGFVACHSAFFLSPAPPDGSHFRYLPAPAFR
jgi:hypothetical protein